MSPLDPPPASAREDRPCVEVTPGEARYLLTIFDLVRDGVRLSQSGLARRLGVSSPTALQMIRRLRQLGLIEAGGLALTSAGTSAALGLGHRRQAARVLALDVLGLDEQAADAEARRLAPAVSSALAQRLMRLKSRHSGAN
jgi:DtxR family Mn-dependent transcriptional regulator